jgi:hypothetical protein
VEKLALNIATARGGIRRCIICHRLLREPATGRKPLYCGPEHRREAEYLRRIMKRRRLRAGQWGSYADVAKKTGASYAAGYRQTSDGFAAEAAEIEARLNPGMNAPAAVEKERHEC